MKSVHMAFPWPTLTNMENEYGRNPFFNQNTLSSFLWERISTNSDQKIIPTEHFQPSSRLDFEQKSNRDLGYKKLGWILLYHMRFGGVCATTGVTVLSVMTMIAMILIYGCNDRLASAHGGYHRRGVHG